MDISQYHWIRRLGCHGMTVSHYHICSWNVALEVLLSSKNRMIRTSIRALFLASRLAHWFTTRPLTAHPRTYPPINQAIETNPLTHRFDHRRVNHSRRPASFHAPSHPPAHSRARQSFPLTHSTTHPRNLSPIHDHFGSNDWTARLRTPSFAHFKVLGWFPKRLTMLT